MTDLNHPKAVDLIITEYVLPQLPDISSLPDNSYQHVLSYAYTEIQSRLNSSASIDWTPATKIDQACIHVLSQLEYLVPLLLEAHNQNSTMTTYFGGYFPDYLQDRINKFERLELIPLYNHRVPFSILEERRFDGGWIIAPPGRGKTQLIQHLILRDLQKVRTKQASVLVMDSQGSNEMLGTIEQLKEFETIPLLKIGTHSSLNIFDIGKGRSHRSEEDREVFTNNAVALINYAFSSSIGAAGALTEKQSVLFDYCVQLLLVVPGATIADFVKLTLPKGLDQYRQYIPRTSPPAQLFFHTQFDHPKQYSDTKNEIRWRLDALLKSTSFARMFTSRRPSLDLFAEFNNPKVILVDTNKALLTDAGTAVFGRLIIAMLLSASQQRARLERHQRLPVYCYIDEAADYFSTDEKIASILDQARKQKIALLLANQRVSQIKSTNVRDALLTTGFQFINTHNMDDATLFAKNWGLEANRFSQPPGSFFYKAVDKKTIQVFVPNQEMENAPKRRYLPAEQTPPEQFNDEPLQGEVILPRDLIPYDDPDDTKPR